MLPMFMGAVGAAPSAARATPFDGTGFVLFVLCAVSALLWVGRVGHSFALRSPQSAGLAAVAIASGALLWRQQRGHPHASGVVAGSVHNDRVSAWTGVSGRLPTWGLGAVSLALAALALLSPTPLTIAVAAGICGIGFGSVMPSAQMGTQILAGRERLGTAAWRAPRLDLRQAARDRAAQVAETGTGGS